MAIVPIFPNARPQREGENRVAVRFRGAESRSAWLGKSNRIGFGGGQEKDAS